MEAKERKEEGTRGATQDNVGTAERVGSALGGSALMVYGITRRSLGGALLAGLGGVLAYRGFTGSCPVYSAIGVSTAADDRPVEAQLDERGRSIERVVTINRSPEELYGFWRNLGNLPKFMSHLASVEMLDGDRSRWVADGPAGSKVVWEAVITDDRPNSLIAWSSLPESEVLNTGRVEFTRAPGASATEVRISLRYSPPAGKVGVAVAKLFGADPATRIAGDLRRFQQIMETGEIACARKGQADDGTGAMPGKSERRFAWGARDNVEEASWESFPASDPPAW